MNKWAIVSGLLCFLLLLVVWMIWYTSGTTKGMLIPGTGALTFLILAVYYARKSKDPLGIRDE